jgi:hypothetical protein
MNYLNEQIMSKGKLKCPVYLRIWSYSYGIFLMQLISTKRINLTCYTSQIFIYYFATSCLLELWVMSQLVYSGKQIGLYKSDSELKKVR